MRTYFVYILASKRNGTLYIGVTIDVLNRAWQHKNDLTKRYGVHILVHFEMFADIGDAITREKQLKKWNRAWKLRLIEETNREWRDLYETMVP